MRHPHRLLRLPALAILCVGVANCGVVVASEGPDVGATESDPALHSDGGAWRLDQAERSDQSLPRVLLIGDSILSGYRHDAVRNLAGEVAVDTWVNPHYQSAKLNKLLGEVLDFGGPYDVVLFNIGLHGWQEGRIPPGQFRPLTKAYVQVLRDRLPDARLIWASSTPVTAKGTPSELHPEINPIIVNHNRMAAEVMQEMDVPVVDYYGKLAGKLNLARGDSFHWQGPAYKILADAAAEAIRSSIKPDDPSAIGRRDR